MPKSVASIGNWSNLSQLITCIKCSLVLMQFNAEKHLLLAWLLPLIKAQLNISPTWPPKKFPQIWSTIDRRRLKRSKRGSFQREEPISWKSSFRKLWRITRKTIKELFLSSSSFTETESVVLQWGNIALDLRDRMVRLEQLFKSSRQTITPNCFLFSATKKWWPDCSKKWTRMLCATRDLALWWIKW